MGDKGNKDAEMPACLPAAADKAVPRKYQPCSRSKRWGKKKMRDLFLWEKIGK